MFSKVLKHDLRCGLFRWKYLLLSLVVSLPLLQFIYVCQIQGTRSSLIDGLLYLFKGVQPLSTYVGPMERAEIPTIWLLVMGACLLLNLTYPLEDLSLTGQQIVIRSHRRVFWCASKYIWNFLATVLCFFLIILGVGAISTAFGGSWSMAATPAVLQKMIGVDMDTSPALVFSAGVILPFLSILAYSFIQMTLCFYMRPVLAYSICMLLLLISAFYNGFSLLGGMAIRTIPMLVQGRKGLFLTPLIVILLCPILGQIRFSQMDILHQEEK